jgi:hypothetical protein
MRLATRSGLTATILAIGAIAAPNAEAGGLFSTGRDPKGADQQEARAFENLYNHTNSNPVPVPSTTASAAGDGFDYGDAAVGAGVAGGIALLTVAGGLTVRRRSQLRHS